MMGSLKDLKVFDVECGPTAELGHITQLAWHFDCELLQAWILGLQECQSMKQTVPLWFSLRPRLSRSQGVKNIDQDEIQDEILVDGVAHERLTATKIREICGHSADTKGGRCDL